MNIVDYSFWDKLKETEKPIILYGTGNGADKIINVLENRNIPLKAIFASDGFVRERYFRGFRVRSYSDIITEYGNDIIILLAFGSNRDEVINFINELDTRHDLIIPEVPLYGGELFDYEYFINHKEMLEKAANILSDDVSLLLMEDAINFRLTGKIKYLKRNEPMPDTLKDLYGNKSCSAIIDGGAFKGDTCEIFINSLNPKNIYAVEADYKTFLKLSEFSSSNTACNIIPMNYSLSDVIGDSIFVSSGSRGSSEQGLNKRAKMVSVACETIDSLFLEKDIDIIKLDVEGNEEKSILGSKEVIIKYNPDFIISLYHKTDDIFSLILLIHELLPLKKLYLRRIPCIPFWDFNLYTTD